MTNKIGKDSKISSTNMNALMDYEICFKSRQASLLGRKEVLTGKAKFGIFGDGKELPQAVMAKFIRPGDWRAGYYRDQTMLMALGQLDIKQFFAQIYADPNPENEPSSAGRQMNNHPATALLDEDGNWLDQLKQFNCSSDISPTAGQMARMLGLSYASKLYRENKNLKSTAAKFSENGNEVVFGTIGNASTSEGIFFEVMNAAGVLGVPLVVSVWDDEYGISVPKEYHTVKQSISEALKGMEHDDKSNGIKIMEVKGWDYEKLVETYEKAVKIARKKHIPVMVHVTELAQPQGHSTSGSHERYKSKDRLKHENDIDCINRFRSWIINNKICSEGSLKSHEKKWLEQVKSDQKAAWDAFMDPIKQERDECLAVIANIGNLSPHVDTIKNKLASSPALNRKLIISSMREILIAINDKNASSELQSFYDRYHQKYARAYNQNFKLENGKTIDNVDAIPPAYNGDSTELVDGRVILRDFFHKKFASDERIFAIGEDIGIIGGVNQVFEGIQKEYGLLRCTDTGIREASIFGQGLGAAMRGLRPIVDIQYLDYLLYCLQPMSDDLASLQYRTNGKQAAPVIIRTKGHRLEGIWHSGSPIGMIVNSIRGMNFCVPRNMTQAAGFYNTLLDSDEPALVIEVLSGYRLKEKMPSNLGEYKIPLGVPEIVRDGKDITVVTYGFNVILADMAAQVLSEAGIEIEIIDVQTLLPFDINGLIADSTKKTNALVVFDEDVSAGATGYILGKLIEDQNIFDYLEISPKLVHAKDHRPAYGTDGDYFSKSNREDLIDACLEIMKMRDPQKFKNLI